MIEPDTRSRVERDRDMWIEEGREIGHRCREADERRSAAAWSLGDWSNAHDRGYGDLRRAVEEGEIGVSYDYVKLCAHVARRIAPERRRAGLSFGHHQAVAALEVEDGDRLLAQAQLQNWSREDIRLAVREASPQAALKRRADKLKQENERLKQEMGAPGADEAATKVADTLRANKADADEIVRLMKRIADRAEDPAFIAAKNALHGNAARGVDGKIADIVEPLLPAMREMGQRIERALVGGDGAANGYAGPNEGAADPAANAGPERRENGYAAPNGGHPPGAPLEQAGGAP